MNTDKQIKDILVKVYSEYLKNPGNLENRQKASEIYLRYFNGANAIFKKEVSSAIWNSFNLSEGKISKEKAREILDSLED